MPRDPESLIDIVTAIRRILRYTDSVSRADLVHEYDQLDLDVIWDVVQNKLSELLRLITPMI